MLRSNAVSGITINLNLYFFKVYFRDQNNDIDTA